MSTSENRREFLQAGIGATAAFTLAGSAGADDDGNAKGLPTRPLGKTGVNVSMLCLGGWHIGSVPEEAEAIKIMHAAIDEGMTFFDNAWDYHDGKSEEWMGNALAQDGKRKKVFLMTKNCDRDAKGTRKHLEDSLRRLKTDYLDLWQFHEINYDNDPEWVVEKGGLAEALKAQKEGKVRFIGFTGHKSPHIHKKMMAVHDWEAVQMPVNICDRFYRSFAEEIIPMAEKIGAGVVGMKSLGGGNAEGGGGNILKGKVCSVDEAIRYALGQKISTLVVGIDSMEVLQQDLRIARNFKPLSAAELADLTRRVKPMATDGRFELFKSGQQFDGPYHRKQHGFEV